MTNRFGIYDYDTANAWLNGSKDKTKNDRSLYQDSGRVRLQRSGSYAISVMYHGLPLVTYTTKGSVLISLPFPYRYYQGARLTLVRYAPMVRDVVIRNGKLVISTLVDGQTPSKITKCRTCKGRGKGDSTCYVAVNQQCWDESCSQYQEFAKVVEIHGYWSDEANVLRHKPHLPCEHGQTTKHIVYDAYDCWRCRGAGKTDYGNRQQGRVWDGDMLLLDQDGNYLELTNNE